MSWVWKKWLSVYELHYILSDKLHTSKIYNGNHKVSSNSLRQHG